MGIAVGKGSGGEGSREEGCQGMRVAGGGNCRGLEIAGGECSRGEGSRGWG